MPLSSKVEVKSGGIHGFCWFAANDIKSGEMVWTAKSDDGSSPHLNFYRTIDQINAMPETVRTNFLDLAYQVSDGLWLGIDPDAPPSPELVKLQYELYINHSCDGNVWHETDDLLVARRDIRRGEELCYDYALTESDPNWLLAPRCLCSATDCRGRVTGEDWRLPQVQAKYGKHFLRYILEKIAAEQEKRAAAAAAAAAACPDEVKVAEGQLSPLIIIPAIEGGRTPTTPTTAISPTIKSTIIMATSPIAATAMVT
jgi:hypothetical protein